MKVLAIYATTGTTVAIEPIHGRSAHDSVCDEVTADLIVIDNLPAFSTFGDSEGSISTQFPQPYPPSETRRNSGFVTTVDMQMLIHWHMCTALAQSN